MTSEYIYYKPVGKWLIDNGYSNDIEYSKRPDVKGLRKLECDVVGTGIKGTTIVEVKTVSENKYFTELNMEHLLFQGVERKELSDYTFIALGFSSENYAFNFSMFKKFGLGVLTVDLDGKVECLQKPVKNNKIRIIDKWK